MKNTSANKSVNKSANTSDKREQGNAKKNVFVKSLPSLITYIIAALVPLIVMLIAFVKTGVYPFGDRTYISIDGKNQYLAFFTEFYEKVKSGDSLLYSWHGGMGYDFLNTYFYYLVSPVNLIVLLFPRTMILEGMTTVILIKMVLSSVNMTYMLRRITEGSSRVSGAGLGWPVYLVSAAFGIMYGLSNYVIGYQINMMWMDAYMLLPLAFLGLVKLAKGGKPFLYIITLAVIIMCNYYVAIPVCIFMVMAYVALRVSGGQVEGKTEVKLENEEGAKSEDKTSAMPEKKTGAKSGDKSGDKSSVKLEINMFLKFAFASLLSGILSAVVLIPSAVNILTNKVDSLADASNYEGFITNPIDTFLQMLPGTEAVLTTNDDSLVNTYCGILAVLGVLLFVCNKKLGLRKRLAGIGVLAILFASFDIKAVNMVFHGLHVAYGFPNRHAFLFVFAMIVMGYVGIVSILDTCLIKDRIIENNSKEPQTGNEISVTNETIVDGEVNIDAKNRPHASSKFYVIAGAALLILVSVEMGSNSVTSIVNYGNADRSSLISRYDYVNSKYDTDTLYRADVTDINCSNEPLLYQVNGIRLFDSVLSTSQVNLAHNLGYYTSLNSINYEGATEVSDMLLGVRTRLYLKRMSSINSYSGVTDDDVIVGNDYYLPLGYVGNPVTVDDASGYASLASSLYSQNYLLKIMTGMELYDIDELDATEGSDASQESDSDDNQASNQDDGQASNQDASQEMGSDVDQAGDSDVVSATYTATASAGEHLVISVSDNKEGNADRFETALQSVSIDGAKYDKKLTRLYDEGEYDEDSEVEVELTFDGNLISAADSNKTDSTEDAGDEDASHEDVNNEDAGDEDASHEDASDEDAGDEDASHEDINNEAASGESTISNYVDSGKASSTYTDSYTVTSGTYSDSDLQAIYNRLNENTFSITDMSSSHVEGSVYADNDGAVYFSIPYSNNWKVTVDGESVSDTDIRISRALGMYAVNVSAGAHEITYDYQVSGLRLGALVSLAGVIVLILILVVFRNKD